MPTEERTQRLLGLTKDQFMSVLIAVVIAIFCIQAYQLHITLDLASRADAQAQVNDRLITDGKEAHDSLCVYKQSLIDSIADNKRFLKETVPERVAEFGDTLGHLPESFVKGQLHTVKDRLTSLNKLTCP